MYYTKFVLGLLAQSQVLVCTTGAAKTQKPTVLLSWRNRRQNPGICQLHIKEESQKGDSQRREASKSVYKLNSVWVSGWPVNHAYMRHSPTSPVKAIRTNWDLRTTQQTEFAAEIQSSKLPAKTNKQINTPQRNITESRVTKWVTITWTQSQIIPKCD